MHSIQEWHHFYEFTSLGSPGGPLGFPTLSDPSQMLPRCPPDAFHMHLSQLSDCNQVSLVLSKPFQPNGLRQVLSPKLSQASDLS